MIPPDVMRELRYLEVYTAKKIRNLRIGPYTSPLRGTGFDFDEHRPYRERDDVRRIDWNVTARLNAPYLRQTHAERELNVVVALDMSPSMTFGSTRYSKKEAMTFIAASILFSASSDQINLGFLAFSDRVLHWSAPRRAGARGWQLLEELWAIKETGTHTAVVPAIGHLVTQAADHERRVPGVGLHHRRRRLRQRRAPDARLAARCDRDRAGRSGRGRAAAWPWRRPDAGSRKRPQPAGRPQLGDPGGIPEAVAERRRTIVDACYRIPIDHLFVRTDEVVMEPLLNLFARRRLG